MEDVKPSLPIGRGRGCGRGRGITIKRTLNVVPLPSVKSTVIGGKRFVASKLFRNSIISIKENGNRKASFGSQIVFNEEKEIPHEVVEVVIDKFQGIKMSENLNEKPRKVREWDKGKKFQPESGQWFTKRKIVKDRNLNTRSFHLDRFEDVSFEESLSFNRKSVRSTVTEDEDWD